MLRRFGGCTVLAVVIIKAERVTTQAALGCTERYFDDEEKPGLPIPTCTAVVAEFGIRPRAKKAIAVFFEVRRAWVARGVDPEVRTPRREAGI